MKSSMLKPGPDQVEYFEDGRIESVRILLDLDGLTRTHYVVIEPEEGICAGIYIDGKRIGGIYPKYNPEDPHQFIINSSANIGRDSGVSVDFYERGFEVVLPTYPGLFRDGHDNVFCPPAPAGGSITYLE